MNSAPHTPFRLAAIAALVGVGLCACTPTLPKSQQVSHDPLLGRREGVLLLVDACVQRDGFGKGDYFVIEEAEAGANAALKALDKFVQDSAIPVRAQIVAVGGARLNKANTPVTVADRVGGPKREVQAPLRIPGAYGQDAQVVQALGTVSTYAFERAAAPSKTAHSRSDTPPPDGGPSIDLAEFSRAAAVLKEKTQASSLLFLGVLGTSRSAGKVATQIVSHMLIGMATAFATAGLGTGFFLVFVPGHQIDGMLMEGALVDLDTGQLTWSNAVRVDGDPIRPEVMANPEALNLLFHDLMFKPVTKP